MAKIKDSLRANGQEATEICSRIKEESSRQIADILRGAREEAEKIVSRAAREAEDKKEQVLKDLQKQLAHAKEMVFSSLNLEKKKVFLEEKDKFVQQVMENAVKDSETFHNAADYPDFLKKAIIEGAAVIDSAEMDIFYSELDAAVFNGAFIKEVTSLVSGKFKKDSILKFHKSDFKDIGVIVQSRDGHLVYDNRFLSRLRRMQDDIHMQLLKESF